MLKFLSAWRDKRKLKPLTRVVAEVAALAPELSALSDDELTARTAKFKDLLSGGATMDALLPEVFATVREAAVRTMRILPYDTQVMGGLALYDGAIAEMGTGEGKTLTAPFAAYAHFLQGSPVHISTANEYLAERDAQSMLALFLFLGMTVGVCRAGQSPEEKKLVYRCDVVYGTHNEFAQDYLRDNLARHPVECVQRELGFAIVDEADAALIDDARTPVVITAHTPADAELYQTISLIAQQLSRTDSDEGEGDFYIDPVARLAVLTEAGYERAGQMLCDAGLLANGDTQALYEPGHQHLLHKLTSALAARHMLFADQHYVVQDGQIVLVDALTGRLLPGRRWDGGLQQALEAKECLDISPEAHLLASISLQNYFRMYATLAGMTGTAESDAEELQHVYGLGVVVIPPNKPSQRVDARDLIFRKQADKLDALVADIQARHAKGQPVLVGTVSIEQSEVLSARLLALGLSHNVLNAKEHAREAEIIAAAGMPGAITVSTNMAGRGVDIVLGGNFNAEMYARLVEITAERWNAMSGPEQKAIHDAIKDAHAARAELVRQAGGLHVIGMERYESRRMDRQLRGRAGRQGDPGSTEFYLALDDPLIENFAGEQIRNMMLALDVKPGEDLEYAMLAQAVDSAQRQLEGHSASMRSQLMQYDDVLNDQRKAVYDLRNSLLRGDDLHALVDALRDDQAQLVADNHIFMDKVPEEWNLTGLRAELAGLSVSLPETDEALRNLDVEDFEIRLKQALAAKQDEALNQVPEAQRVNALRYVTVSAVDRQWFAHLEELEHLRKGIHLRGFAKEDPKQAYKREAFALFERMLDAIRYDIVKDALTWRIAE